MKFEYESSDERIDELRQLANLLMDGPSEIEKASAVRRNPRSDEFDVVLSNAIPSLHSRPGRS